LEDETVPFNERRPKVNTIGLDAHSASFTLGTLDGRGKLRGCVSRATSAQNLIELVSQVPGPKQLVVEESHLAQWIKTTLEPYVDRLIVCDPRQNRWLAEEDFVDDRRSAIKLAELCRGGYLKEIYHPDEAGAQWRSLFLHYYDLNHQLTRFKNKLKAVYRQRGQKVSGQTVYRPERQEEWLARLRAHPWARHQAAHGFELVEVLERMKQETYRAMVRRARKVRGYELLQGIPGVGPVIATGYMAMLVTPHRFSRKNKLWRYGGLGNRYRESDEVVYDKGSSPSGNRVVKWLVVQHFQGAVERVRGENRFKRKYRELVRRGLSARTARRHVCLSLLSVVRAVWMKGEPYREGIVTTPETTARGESERGCPQG